MTSGDLTEILMKEGPCIDPGHLYFEQDTIDAQNQGKSTIDGNCFETWKNIHSMQNKLFIAYNMFPTWRKKEIELTTIISNAKSHSNSRMPKFWSSKLASANQFLFIP